MRDPVILIDYANQDNLLSIPITCKPLPALLAPPSPLNHHGSLSSFASSVSSSTSIQQHEQVEEHAYLQQKQPIDYYHVIQKQSQEIQDLRQDLIKLNQKYIDQIERIQIAEKAKFQVESELEELSSRLFEQANEMVAQEKKARFIAEKKVAKLERELSNVYEALDNEKEQLKELKSKFAAIDNNSMSTIEHPLSVIEQNTPLQQANILIDDGWLTLFKEFLTLSPNTPLESIHKLPFMKQCFELDILPCLKFTYKLSMKKVLEAIIKQPCFIESKKRYSHDQQLVRRSSFATIFKSRKDEIQCHGCGNTIQSNSNLFRFKLKESDLEWFWIDRNCRDKLVAVCNFFVFIRHLRQGLQDQKSIQSLFQESVWLRLVMFWARSGVQHLTL